MTRESVLTRTFVELADNLVNDFDVVDLLTLLADRCVEILDVTAAGIMLASPDLKDLRIVASSSEAMMIVEDFELQSGEGPCLDCYHSGRPVLNELLGEHRWPIFEKEALASGYHTVHSLPLRLRGETIGALNLFNVEEYALSDEDVLAGQSLADVATITILQQRVSAAEQLLAAQLQQALNSRIIIEQAKGVLAERAALDMDAAFARMRAHARNNHRKLVEVASEVIDGSALSDVASGR